MGGAFWILKLLFWFFRIVFAAFAAIYTRRQKKGATYIQVLYFRSIKTFPGYYFYIYFSRGFTSSFPIFAIWYLIKSLGRGNEIGFLLSENKKVFNYSSFKIRKGLRLDGLYGRNIDLWNYKSVILAAKGMGIAGILSSALFLFDRHNLNTMAKKESISFDNNGAIRYKNRIFRNRTRKIILIWILEDNCQEDWAAAQIRNLQKINI